MTAIRTVQKIYSKSLLTHCIIICMNTDGGILLPPTCKINYINMQHKYVQAALAVKFSFFTHLENLSK